MRPRRGQGVRREPRALVVGGARPAAAEGRLTQPSVELTSAPRSKRPFISAVLPYIAASRICSLRTSDMASAASRALAKLRGNVKTGEGVRR